MPHHARADVAPAPAPKPAPGVKRYFVLTGRSGGWLIFREGAARPMQHLRWKQAALHTAKVIARNNAPSEVLAERPDGSLRVRYAFHEGGEHQAH